jgi:GNAT superfamily N-acetyltransferase
MASVGDAGEVARLLHDFNTEFATPTPGPEVLAGRLAGLLAGDATFAVLGPEPDTAVALVTLRTNVWYDGPVALLDELYVVPHHRGQGIGSAVLQRVVAACRARGAGLVEINVDESDVDALRFYRRHGFTDSEPGNDERAFYVWQELVGT